MVLDPSYSRQLFSGTPLMLRVPNNGFAYVHAMMHHAMAGIQSTSVGQAVWLACRVML